VIKELTVGHVALPLHASADIDPLAGLAENRIDPVLFISPEISFPGGPTLASPHR
jgi:hypothetical protein